MKLPIDVTDNGIVTYLSNEHSKNALCPIDVTDIWISVSDMHLRNASSLFNTWSKKKYLKGFNT